MGFQRPPTQTAPEILDVAADNVDKTGFFCFMSKKKSEGYQRKLRWLKDRFADGMRIKMLVLCRNWICQNRRDIERFLLVRMAR